MINRNTLNNFLVDLLDCFSTSAQMFIDHKRLYYYSNIRTIKNII